MKRSTYSLVRSRPDGGVEVQLAGDHPGVSDPAYRRRRDDLAALAVDWRPGEAIPHPEYESSEHAVWETVSDALADLHPRHAAEAFLEGKAELDLPRDHVPQLDEVTAALAPRVGFGYLPVAGLAPLREFYKSFADGEFFSTQYLRHPSLPLYTPEPDIIHEVIGHANQLAAPGFAELYKEVGAAVGRSESEEALCFLSRVFWYTMEFGVVQERGAVRAFGAGILSSVGETEEFGQAEIRPASFEAMASIDYDITRYQDVLFCWPSMEEFQARFGEFLTEYDDAAFSLWAKR